MIWGENTPIFGSTPISLHSLELKKSNSDSLEDGNSEVEVQHPEAKHHLLVICVYCTHEYCIHYNLFMIHE